MCVGPSFSTGAAVLYLHSADHKGIVLASSALLAACTVEALVSNQLGILFVRKVVATVAGRLTNHVVKQLVVAYESFWHKDWYMLMVTNSIVEIILQYSILSNTEFLLPITEDVSVRTSQRTIIALTVKYYSKFDLEVNAFLTEWSLTNKREGHSVIH